MKKGNNEMELNSLREGLLSGQALLVDVREQDEWEKGHVQNALHLPLSSLEKIEHIDLPKNKTFYLYCKKGGRALRAKEILAHLLKEQTGCTIIALNLGFDELKKANFPT